MPRTRPRFAGKPTGRFRCALAAVLIWGLTACSQAPAGPSWTIIKVYDGDTVLAEGPEGTVLVRMVGIDAPERGKERPSQPFSRKARDYLSSRVKQKRVALTAWGKDRYGRLLGEIVLDGDNINREMVSMGLAEVYRGRTPEGFDVGPYRAAEADAKASRKGIWSLGNRYVSPVEWKHRPR